MTWPAGSARRRPPRSCRRSVEQAVHVAYPGAVYTFYHQHVRLQMHATPPAGQTGPVTFHANRLPIGLHLNAATGVITGRVTRAGVRTVTVSASTGAGTYGAVRFNWAVERRPQVAAAVAGPSLQPALTFTVKSGEFEPGLRDLTITLPRRLTLAGGARAVRVQSISGRTLVHQAHFQNHVLTIMLAVAHSPVRIVFAAGSLRALATSLVSSAWPSRPSIASAAARRCRARCTALERATRAAVERCQSRGRALP